MPLDHRLCSIGQEHTHTHKGTTTTKLVLHAYEIKDKQNNNEIYENGFFFFIVCVRENQAILQNDEFAAIFQWSPETQSHIFVYVPRARCRPVRMYRIHLQ